MQRQHDEVHQLRIQEKAQQRFFELESQELSRKELLEKARQKAATMENLQQNWSSQATSDDKQLSKKKKRKGNAVSEGDSIDSTANAEISVKNDDYDAIFDSDSDGGDDTLESGFDRRVLMETNNKKRQHEDEEDLRTGDNSVKLRRIIDDDDN